MKLIDPARQAMPIARFNMSVQTFNALPRTLVMACALGVSFMAAAGALAQDLGNPGDPFGSSSPAVRPPPSAQPISTKPRSTSGLSEFATEELVAEIQVRGNRTVPASRITHQMQTRVGRPYDPRALAADIKKLASLPYFVTVRPMHRSTEAGRVIVLEVVERRALRYVEYLGNKKLKDKKIAEATGLTVGGAVDPYAVEEGKRKIESLYQEQGYGRVYVEIVEGQKASDQGVVYSIDEGTRQKIWAVEFEGNRFASDGQLKNKIKSKPGFARLFGGKLNRSAVEDDVRTITDYYRSFGFFRASVGRVIELNDEGTWATIRYAINEGPRYRVRNVTMNGVEVFSPEQVREGLTLQGGQDYEKSKLQTDMNWLRDLYGSKGYVFADVKPEQVFLETPGEIDLVYNIEEGEKWRIGKIIVKINGETSHTRKQVALNRTGMVPGDILDTTKLRDAERRMGAAGVFNTNPATGTVPKITYQPSPATKQRFAERDRKKAEEAKGVFRGQSIQPTRHTSYKPPVPPTCEAAPPQPSAVYRIQQLRDAAQAPGQVNSSLNWGDRPGDTGFYGQNAPADSFGNAPAAPFGDAPADPFDGVAVAPTDSSAAAIGQPETQVPQLGTAPIETPRDVVPVQYSQPNYPSTPLPPPSYGQPGPSGYGVVGAGPPPVPVNTQIFPSQVYAPTPVPPPNDPFADLVINLEETQTGRFMIGAAVNSDAGVVGQISLDERNFDWRRFPRSFQDVYDGTAWRGGGQRFRLEAAPGTQVQRYLMSWSEPYLLDSPISLNLSGSYYDRRFDDWDESRLGGRVGLGYQWVDRDLSASLTYRGENVEIRDPRDPSLEEYQAVLGDNSLHGFGVRFVTDKRNNPFLATDGYYFSLGLEQVVGSFTYGRAELDMRTYLLLRERPDHTGRHVLTFQNRTSFTGADTPIYDRFYAGGFSTMRGYDFRGASPVKGAFNSEVGGDFLFINTLEYMFPITADDMINGVVFVDHGTVNESISLDNYRVAPGVGLRVTVPAMGPAPIALDFAFPITGPATDEERVFTFNVGFSR